MKGFFYAVKRKEKDSGEITPRVKRSVIKKDVIHELPSPLKLDIPNVKKQVEKNHPINNRQMEMDVECFLNYFLIKFHKYDGTFVEFEMIENSELNKADIQTILKRHQIVTFNGIRYDFPMLNYALNGRDVTNRSLKVASDDLILRGMSVYKFEQKYNLKPMKINGLDLIELCPGYMSLKTLGVRLHSSKLQSLPYNPHSKLTIEQMKLISQYCENDLIITNQLKNDLFEELDLRESLSKQYKVDLMSKSDAQIAEEIIKIEVLNRTGKKVQNEKDLHTKEFYYQLPDFIRFKNEQLTNVLEILKNNKFEARPVSSGIKMPKELNNLKIQIGNSLYRMGIGGLHSSEKSQFHLSDDEYDFYDWDVASYYPSIILQCGLYPLNIGHVFLDIFKDVVESRLKAKKAGNKVKANSLKITINGTFGKLGSPYSVLYAPELMIQVTITGQLSLLMLIEMLHNAGFEVVSGNTDGIVVKCEKGRDSQMRKIINRWELRTGFNMEESRYAGLYCRDVNNYMAIKHDGEVKLKGCFAYASRQKNPEYDICTDALIEYLKYKTPIEEVIRKCTDIRKFISVRQVNGGAIKGTEEFGKVIRWYYSTNEVGTVNYKTNGNKVPQTEGAKVLLELPDKLPDDIDYEWYIKKCKNIFY